MAREVPQYIQQMTIGSLPQVQFTNAQAETTMGIAKTFDRASDALISYQDGIREKAAKIEKMNLQTTLRTQLNDYSNQFGADVGGLKSAAEGYKSGFIKTIKDPDLAEEFKATYDAELIPFIDKATTKYNKNLDDQLEVSARGHVASGIATLGATAQNLFSNVPEVRASAQAAMAKTFEDIAATAAFKKQDGTYMFTPEQQVAMAGEAQKELLASLTPDKQLEALGEGTAAQGGFEAVMPTIFKNEGGYSAHDGNTDNPVNFGINQKAHPEIDVKTLTQADAAKIYKKDYWDKYGVGELPANVQGIVMDGVVNHSSAFSNKLVKAAKDGATPSELLDMRQNEYERLAKADPKKYASNMPAWNARLAGFEHLTLGEHLNFITPKLRMEITKSAMEALAKDQKEKIDDPAAYGLRHGFNTQQIVQMQADPLTASVIPNSTSKQMVEQVNNFSNSDELVGFAQHLRSQYGEYAVNALRDLRNAKLPDAAQAAISLAIENPETNHERIALLHEVSRAGDKGLDDAFRQLTAQKPVDLEATLAENAADSAKAMLNEGYSVEDVTRNINITSSLAKAYMVKNPNADAGDAIDFAMKGHDEKYKYAELNGVKYRVPTRDKYGTILDVNDIEERLKSHYDNMKFKLSATDKAIAENASKSIKELAIPYLNAEKDGIRFRSPTGDILYGEDGKPAEMKFSQVLSQPTPREIQKQKVRNGEIPPGAILKMF